MNRVNSEGIWFDVMVRIRSSSQNEGWTQIIFILDHYETILDFVSPTNTASIEMPSANQASFPNMNGWTH